MIGAIYRAVSGGLVEQKRMELLSHNIANVSTAGFKEERAGFPGYQVQSEGGTGPSSSLPLLMSRTDFSAGPLEHTGNALDVAIDGKGFFCVQSEEGTLYTRKGSFAVNEEGILVTQGGMPVMGEGGEIEIDGEEVVISGEGNISVDGKEVGMLRVVEFPEPYDMDRVRDTFFRSEAAGQRPEITRFKQGFLEQSNVNPVRAMTEMIEVIRGYESYQKMIQALSTTSSKAINKVGAVV